ncbi:MAG: adenylosuccinate lyase family protein [Acetobacterales bacterium]
MGTSHIDSWYFGGMFGSERMRTIFSDEGRVQGWLDMEAGLARAQAKIGMIPKEAAEKITAAAKLENIDRDAMRAEFDKVGFPILPLVHALAKAVDKETARYVHWGSTTQDVLDTGTALQLKAGFDVLDDYLGRLEDLLLNLAEAHRDTVMVGRTMQQQAAPITFGYKVAVWLFQVHRHRQRLGPVRERAVLGQIAGAVGTNATYQARGLEVLEATCAELGLGETPISWHVARDGMTEATMLLGLVSGTLAQIGNEVMLLARTEVAEVAEPFESGRGASSTLPQKRNPILCQPLIAAGRMMREKVALACDAMVWEHERSGQGMMHLEWDILPQAFVILGGMFENAFAILDGLVVDTDRMRENLMASGGLPMTEAVMMGLAPHVGRNVAHDIVYAAVGECTDSGKTLREALLGHAGIAAHLTPADIDRMLDPANHVGTAPQMVGRVVAQVKAARHK